jgi:hypothetical protein
MIHSMLKPGQPAQVRVIEKLLGVSGVMTLGWVESVTWNVKLVPDLTTEADRLSPGCTVLPASVIVVPGYASHHV